MPLKRAPSSARKDPSAATIDLQKYLQEYAAKRRSSAWARRALIYAQGDAADTIFYILSGKVKITVVSTRGKEAVVAILAAGDFFGEGALAGQPVRMATARALTDCRLLKIKREVMVAIVQDDPHFSQGFVQHLLKRSMRLEEDLVDQLFNSSEKRLARALLILANFGKAGQPEPIIPHINQETLAEMIGTTRSRVSFFLNKFRRLEFITYSGTTFEVHSSLLNVILRD
jgi:CRP-like cAMP-binding protein